MGKMEGVQEEKDPGVFKIRSQTLRERAEARTKTNQFWQKTSQFCHLIKRTQWET